MQGVKVLFLTSSSARRGAEQQASRVASLLGDAGVEVVRRALVSGGGTNVDNDLAVLGQRALGLRTLYRLRRLARGVDLTVAYGASTLPACAMAFALSGHRFAYRSIGDPRDWVRGGLHRWRTGVLLRRASAVITQSAEVGRGIAEVFDVSSSRLVIIPNLPPSDSFRPPTEDERIGARRSFGLGTEVEVVAFVGALAPEKRVDLILRAASRLENVEVLVVGEGVELPRLRREAESLSVRVIFAGAMIDTAAAYWAADVLALASVTEGQPSVVLEAAMSGVPVVACDVGSVSELFSRGVGGVLIDREIDDEGLAAALSAALSHGDREAPRAPKKTSESDLMVAWKDLLFRLAARSPSKSGSSD